MPPRVALIVVLIVVHVSVVGPLRHPTAAALSLEDIDSRTEPQYSPVGANQATRFVDDPMAALPYSRVPKQVARESNLAVPLAIGRGRWPSRSAMFVSSSTGSALARNKLGAPTLASWA